MLLQYFTSKILTNQYLEVLLLNRQLPVGKRSRMVSLDQQGYRLSGLQ